MYEQIRTKLMADFQPRFDLATIERIMPILDKEFANYEITKKVTDLVPYQYSDPECLNIYLASLDLEGYSKGTIQNYKYALRKFLAAENKPVHLVTTNDIRIYLSAYKAQFNTDDRSLEKIRQYINGFFKWCFIEGYVDSNPCARIRAIKYEIKERKPLTTKEMSDLRYHCRRLFDKALVEMLYSTGCRVSELCGMKKSDVEWDAGRILVTGKGKKQRYVYMNDDCVTFLKRYLRKREDGLENLFVFVRSAEYIDFHPEADLVTGITTAIVEDRLRYLAQKAGITKPVTPHVIRHTTATVMLQRGAPLEIIQEVLGHKSIQTTEIYAQHKSEEIQSVHRRCIG